VLFFFFDLCLDPDSGWISTRAHAGDPEENSRRVASYHAAGLKVGPSWKMSY
jgi:hypothetical protein